MILVEGLKRWEVSNKTNKVSLQQLYAHGINHEKNKPNITKPNMTKPDISLR